LKSTHGALLTLPKFFQQKFRGFASLFGTHFIIGQRAESASVKLWLGEMSKGGSFSSPFAAALNGKPIKSLPVRVFGIKDVKPTHRKNFRGIGGGFGFHKSAKFG
jgi:hypothetical protein